MSKNSKRTVPSHKVKISDWRFYLVLAVICLIYTGLIARAAYIQVFEPDMLKEQGDLRSLRVTTNKVQRGSIVDRNGYELAISVPVETVWADPKMVIAKKSLMMTEHWQALSEVLGQKPSKLSNRIVSHPNKRFVYIERKVSPTIAQYIKKLNIPGIYLRKESKRYYPAGEITAHVVGFTNVDDKGIEGVERVYNQLLTGKGGSTRFRKDGHGRKIEILSVKKKQQPKNITLSIDQRIQAIAYKALKGAVSAFKATSGSAVVTNVHTGEILALVNSPSYNPNNRKHIAPYRFRNRAITDVYEPGSTMKPLTVIAGLEFGSITKDSIIDTSPGWMRLGGRRVSDPFNRGKLSVTDVLVHSSNMGTSKIALSVPKDFLLNKFFDAGFGENTGTGLIGESSGIMHDRPRWSKFELATLSWGAGLAITPVQLARFYTAIANGGIKIPLTILKKTKDSTQYIQPERIFSKKSAHDVLAMLEKVVNEHVQKAKVAGYRVGGKTGTSFKAIAGGYGNDYVGLFAGIAPIEKPQLAVVVVINEPGGDLYEGAQVAAPVFSRIMKGALQVLNIAPSVSARVTNEQLKNKITKQHSNREDHDNV